jgi:hypothetical protein
VSTDYEQGAFSALRLTGSADSGDGRLRVEREDGTLQPVLSAHRSLSVELAGDQPLSALVDAEKLPWDWTFRF